MYTDAAATTSSNPVIQPLDSILNASLNGIIAYEAVRNDAAIIHDFRAITLNQIAQQVLNLPDTTPGWLMLSRFPDVEERGFFAQYVRVVETGSDLRFETTYDVKGQTHWYDVAVVRMDDGFVITFNDITDRKKAGFALAQQESLLNGLVNNVQFGLVLLKPVRNSNAEIIDLRHIMINEKAAALLGRTVENTIGRTMLEMYPDAHKLVFRGSPTNESILSRYCRQIREGGSSTYEFYYDGYGLNKWFQATANALTDGEGLVVSFVDITAIKQNQQALEQTITQHAQQTELLNGVLNSSQSGIMSLTALRDATGNIIDFQFVTSNRASERILGLSKTKIHQSTLLRLFPGNINTGLFDLYKRTTEGGQSQQREVYYNLDGFNFWLDISTQKLGDGLVVTFTDISAVKRAAQAVEQAAAASDRQAALLNTVLNNSQTAISLHEAIRDETSKIVDFQTIMANKKATAMWGELAESIMNQPFFAVTTSEQQAIDFPKYVNVVETGEPDLTEFSMGEERLLRLTAKSGDGVVISNIDITKIHQLQQQLEASVVDLKRSNANLEQFAYVASHDLQEPLRKIRSFGDIIATQYAPLLDEQGTDLIHRMQSAAERMQVLIKDVLAYSRIATRRENISHVNLNEICREVLENLEALVTEKAALITVEPLPTVVGDAPQLRQLFQNLISNALKFARPGVTPTVIVSCQQVKGEKAGMVVSTHDASRRFHRIDLQDNGIGFDPQHAERIFQVFQRLHNRSNYAGTGIGLAIVQKVVENHHGYIAAAGKPGEGATFSLLLPMMGEK